MGVGQSKNIIDYIDTSTLEYEYNIEEEYIGDYRYVKWNTVPESIKIYMKEYVAKYYKAQLDSNDDFKTYICIPKQREYSEKHKLFISYDNAILDYFKDIKMDIPFTLSKNKGWHINRLYNVTK